ncbi:unnamed protein product [marine sediment metagenome]|uniref:Uncharacterized protein n=1 Tax=marine sediment metagenome TaxID=412755 RepID=X1BEG9_9ZZZZ
MIYGQGGAGSNLGALAEAADGQLPIGDTGGVPILATLTAGTGVSIASAAGSITISSSESWNNITGTSSGMLINEGYIANNAALVTLTLPATAVIGAVVRVVGNGAGGWLIAQNAGQTCHLLSSDTTTGGGGSLASTTRYDTCELICTVINTDFVVKDVNGNLTVV